MHSWAEKLKRLQVQEIRIARLREELSGMPDERRKVRERYAGEMAAVKAAQDALKAQELKNRDLEGQIAVIQAKKKDFQAKSSLIKSNDEYRMAMCQIEQCDHSVSDLVDRQLEILEEMEAQEKVIAERQAALKAAKDHAVEFDRDLDEREAELKKSIAALEATLPGLEEGIEPKFLAEYRRLRGSRQTPSTRPVLFPVEGEACGGCRMRVSAQVKNNAMKGYLVCCPSCQSMLYWDD